jgi:hypothetical protein
VLKTPAYNPHAAFCCAGCHAGFYRARCIVCEAPIVRKTEGQKVCRRPKCRSEFRRDRACFLPTRYMGSPAADISPGSALFTGLKVGLKADRAWRVVAGPDLPSINLRIPIVHAVADRRFPTGLFGEAGQPALFQHHSMPVNIVGGYPFAGAPALDLIQTAAESAVVVDIIAAAALIATTTPDLSIPPFLKRTVTRPAAEESVS